MCLIGDLFLLSENCSPFILLNVFVYVYLENNKNLRTMDKKKEASGYKWRTIEKEQ